MRSSGNQRFRVWEASIRIPRAPSTLQEVGNSSYLVYFPFLGWTWSDVQVPVGHPSPRRRAKLRLSEEMELPQEERGSPPGRRSVRLRERVRLDVGMYA